MIHTFVMTRPQMVGTKMRGHGEPVPEAHLWRLTEGMVRHGRLREVLMPEAEFAAAVTMHCPGDADKIYAKLGMTPVVLPGTRKGRATGSRTVLLSPPTPIDG